MNIWNMYARYVLLFLIGMTTTLRMAQGYILAVEFAKKEHQVITGSVVFSFDGSPFLILPLYYMFISKSWLYIEYVALGVSVLSLILTWWLPESPKILHSLKKYDEA